MIPYVLRRRKSLPGFGSDSRGKWDELKTMVRELQIVNMKMKYLPKPVVIAPAGMALARWL